MSIQRCPKCRNCYVSRQCVDNFISESQSLMDEFGGWVAGGVYATSASGEVASLIRARGLVYCRRAPQVLYLYRGTVDGQIRLDTLLRGEGRDRDAEDGSSSYETSASAVKGVVSSLTTIANSIFDQSSREITINTENSNSPSSPQELMKRIGAEYTENNYLWTGNIDSSSFAADCTFTDPTLSFQGVDKFVSNVQ
ncbi:hypothetical protein THAOC_03742, partial [Thalassiosira oceanica]